MLAYAPRGHHSRDMSIQPHTVVDLNPFEKLTYIPESLRTVDTSHRVTVINADPGLSPEDPNDLFGLEILLGGLAGVRPFGEQTTERVAARNAFHELVVAGLRDTKELRDLGGRIGFIDAVARDGTPDSSESVIQRVVGEEPQGDILLIAPEDTVWKALAAALRGKANGKVYRASYERRKPPTEKGMKWTIVEDTFVLSPRA